MAEERNVHTSAVCWIPPVDQQEPIQALRSAHDRQIERWPPHVNLLYPFVPLDCFEEAASVLGAALKGMRPFEVEIRQLRNFKHGKKSFTGWLAPDGADARWQELQTLCLQSFPFCSDQTARGAFEPHLTIGQFQEETHVKLLTLKLARTWKPITCTVGEVCLISRAGADHPFLVHWRVPLGGGTPQREEPPVRRIWPPQALSEAGGDSTLEPPASAAASSAADMATVRITLAANANRSVCCAMLVSSKADLTVLGKRAKNKLRLHGKLSFFRDGGDHVTQGSSLAQGDVVLVSRGEPYVGGAASASTVSSVSALPPLEPSGDAGYPREWLPHTPDAGGLRLMTWNLLASVLCTGTEAGEQSTSPPVAPELPGDGWAGVRYCESTSPSDSHGVHPGPHVFRASQAALEWSARAPQISREILSANAAALCLQEVDAAGMAYLDALLTPRGYQHATSKALGVHGSHGLALFWDTSRVVSIGEPAVLRISPHGDKCALWQRLKDTATGRQFVLATTHLKAGVSEVFERERERQAQALIDALVPLLAEGDSSDALILAGDLNAHHSVIAQDKLGRPLHPLALPLLLAAGRCRCAYAESARAAAPYTYWAGWADRDVRTAFDHVLLRGGVECKAVLAVPDAALIEASPCRLPNAAYPSDHISLVVEVAFADTPP